MKSSGISGGVAGANQKFWFAENQGKSPENPGKNSAQRCLTSQNDADICIKTHEDLFWRLHQKEVFMIFVGENT